MSRFSNTSTSGSIPQSAGSPYHQLPKLKANPNLELNSTPTFTLTRNISSNSICLPICGTSHFSRILQWTQLSGILRVPILISALLFVIFMLAPRQNRHCASFWWIVGSFSLIRHLLRNNIMAIIANDSYLMWRLHRVSLGREGGRRPTTFGQLGRIIMCSLLRT